MHSRNGKKVTYIEYMKARLNHHENINSIIKIKLNLTLIIKYNKREVCIQKWIEFLTNSFVI